MSLAGSTAALPVARGSASLSAPAVSEGQSRQPLSAYSAAARFHDRGLPPGEYRVVAAMDVYRPELLGRLSNAGIPLARRPLATPVLDLRLTPAIPSAAAR